jgi:3-methylcrotonyl-CoA carboxylase alpha subunit
MNGDGYQDLQFRHDDAVVTVRAHPGPEGARLDLAGGAVQASCVEDAAGMALRVDGVLHRLRVVRGAAGRLTVILAGRNHELVLVDPLAPPRQEAAGEDRVIAPIPARVARVLVSPGDTVRKGTPLLVLEAMKMELTLKAPLDGKIASIRAKVDDMVAESTELITFA